MAYFPDSFGHSPALPSLLKAAGFSMAAVTRIDGMVNPASYHELICKRFPRPRSSAELLLKEKRCLDFIWRGPDGAERGSEPRGRGRGAASASSLWRQRRCDYVAGSTSLAQSGVGVGAV